MVSSVDVGAGGYGGRAIPSSTLELPCDTLATASARRPSPSTSRSFEQSRCADRRRCGLAHSVNFTRRLSDVAFTLPIVIVNVRVVVLVSLLVARAVMSSYPPLPGRSPRHRHHARRPWIANRPLASSSSE